MYRAIRPMLLSLGNAFLSKWGVIDIQKNGLGTFVLFYKKISYYVYCLNNIKLWKGK